MSGQKSRGWNSRVVTTSLSGGMEDAEERTGRTWLLKEIRIGSEDGGRAVFDVPCYKIIVKEFECVFFNKDQRFIWLLVLSFY